MIRVLLHYKDHSYGRLLLREYVCDTDGLTATCAETPSDVAING